MNQPTQIRKNIYPRVILALGCWVLSWTPGLAQQPSRLPDSVQIEDSSTSSLEDSKITVNQSVEQQTAPAAATSEVDTLSFRVVPDSTRRAYDHDREFAYANDSAYWASSTTRGDNKFFDYIFGWLSTSWFKGLLYLFLGSILIYALYKIIFEHKLYLFYAPAKKGLFQHAENPLVSGDDLETLIDNAVLSKDFRSAVRWLHLKAIRVAGGNGWIDMEPKATNQQYLQQMAQHPALDDFRFLTQVYEHVWFGRFDLDPEQYDKFQAQFDHFFNMKES